MKKSALNKIRTMADAAVADWHVPVMCDEVIALLKPADGRTFLDGTLGGGGHSCALLESGARVVGMDRDQESLNFATKKLERFQDRFIAIHGNFAEASAIAAVQALAPFDGAILDLGVSSHQLDSAQRGFSFQKDGPLDMRMDTSSGISAAHLVNTESEDVLVQIFRDYGNEPHAKRIARAIVNEREHGIFTRTGQLSCLIEKVIGRKGRVHPATRAFQALRIVVNDELGALQKALETIPAMLRPGARFVVIAFHSLEDRVVKTFFRRGSEQWIQRPEWPEPRPNPHWQFEQVSRKAIKPDLTETICNPRSRSARLRVVEMLGGSKGDGK